MRMRWTGHGGFMGENHTQCWVEFPRKGITFRKVTR